MKTRLLVVLLTLSSATALQARGGPVWCTPHTNITLTSQAEVDQFFTNHGGPCNTVVGTLRLEGAGIVNLNPLNGLAFVFGNLEIDGTGIPDLDGLELLESIGTGGTGGLEVINNPALLGLFGLESLTLVNEFISIEDNALLGDIDDLMTLQGPAPGVFIRRNPSLERLSGLAGLTSIVNGSLVIDDNDALADLHGLGSVTSVSGALELTRNDGLVSAEHLQTVNSVGGGRRGPTVLEVKENPNLEVCGALAHLGDVAVGGVNISGNGADCSESPAIANLPTLDYDTASGDWASGSNWDPVVSPSGSRDVLVRNGGTANESAADVEARLAVVGDVRTGGDGTLNVSGTGQEVRFPSGLLVASSLAGYPTVDATTLGDVEIVDAASVAVGDQEAFDFSGVGFLIAPVDGTLDSEGTLNVTDTAGSVTLPPLPVGRIAPQFPELDYGAASASASGELNVSGVGGDVLIGAIGSELLLDDAHFGFDDSLVVADVRAEASSSDASLASLGEVLIASVAGNVELEEELVVAQAVSTGGLRPFEGEASAVGAATFSELDGDLSIGFKMSVALFDVEALAGSAARGEAYDVFVDGDLLIEGVDGTIETGVHPKVDSGDLEVGVLSAPNNSASGRVGLQAAATIRDSAALRIGSDVEVAGAESSPGRGALELDAELDASLMIEDVTTVDIFDDIDVGTIKGTSDSENSSVSSLIDSTSSLTIRNVASLAVGQGSGSGEFNTGLIDFDEAGDPGVFTPAVTTSATTVLDNVIADVTRITRVAVIDSNTDSPAPGVVATSAGSLTLHSSALSSPTVEVGVVAPGHPGTAIGVLELNPSYVSADALVIGEGGQIIFNVEGASRANPGNLGSDGLYAAVDATNVELIGDVVIRVNAVPSASGVYLLNLIHAESITLDPAMTVSIEGLSSGVMVGEPTVVPAEGGRSNYQVAISVSSVVAIPTLGFWQLALLALVLGGIGIRRMAG